MTVYETGISGEMTSSMIARLRHYLDELKDLQFVILLGVRVYRVLLLLLILHLLLIARYHHLH